MKLFLQLLRAPRDLHMNTPACCHSVEREEPQATLCQQRKLPNTGNTRDFITSQQPTTVISSVLWFICWFVFFPDIACLVNTYFVRMTLGSEICHVLHSKADLEIALQVLQTEVKLCRSVRKMLGMLRHWLTKLQLLQAPYFTKTEIVLNDSNFYNRIGTHPKAAPLVIPN